MKKLFVKLKHFSFREIIHRLFGLGLSFMHFSATRGKKRYKIESLVLSNEPVKISVEFKEYVKHSSGYVRLFKFNQQISELQFGQDAITNETVDETSFFPLAKYKSNRALKLYLEQNKLYFLPKIALSIRLGFDQLESFISVYNDVSGKIRPFRGVSSKSALEVATRTINLIAAVRILNGNKKQHISLPDGMRRYLNDNRTFIKRNISLYSSIGNHTLIDLLGLCYLSLIDQDISDLKKYHSKFSDYFEMQFHDDGFPKESSSAYAVYNIEIALHFYLLLCESGIETSHLFTRRIKLAIDNLMVHTVNGTVEPVRFGDDDSGGVFKVTENSDFELSNRMLNLLALMKLAGFITSEHYCEDSMSFYRLLYPNAEKQTLNFAIENSQIDIGTRFQNRFTLHLANENSGFLVLHDKLGLPPFYGHGHADFSSINVFNKGLLLLADPGSGYYTNHRALRDFFRSERSHNKTFVEIRPEAEMKLPFVQSPLAEYSAVHKNGYLYMSTLFQAGQSIQRKVAFDTNQVQIVDSNSDSEEVVCGNFVISPNTKVTQKGNTVSLQRGEARCTLSFSKHADVRIQDAHYSPIFSFVHESKVIAYSFKESTDITIRLV